jgi:hypothetical protein
MGGTYNTRGKDKKFVQNFSSKICESPLGGGSSGGPSWKR